MSTDTVITGARFGPYGIRSGSRRQRAERGYSLQLGLNPYTHGLGTVSHPYPVPALPSTTWTSD